MNDFNQQQRLLTNMLQEALDCLQLIAAGESPTNEEQQDLIDYWSAEEGAMYICLSTVDNRIYQDVDTIYKSKLQELVSKETLNTYVESGELSLVTVVGKNYKTILLGAIDRHYLVGAFTKFDWMQDRTTTLEDAGIEFMFNNTVEPVMQKLAVNRLTTLLQECRQWNLRDEQSR